MTKPKSLNHLPCAWRPSRAVALLLVALAAGSYACASTSDSTSGPKHVHRSERTMTEGGVVYSCVKRCALTDEYQEEWWGKVGDNAPPHRVWTEDVMMHGASHVCLEECKPITQPAPPPGS